MKSADAEDTKVTEVEANGTKAKEEEPKVIPKQERNEKEVESEKEPKVIPKEGEPEGKGSRGKKKKEEARSSPTHAVKPVRGAGRGARRKAKKKVKPRRGARRSKRKKKKVRSSPNQKVKPRRGVRRNKSKKKKVRSSPTPKKQQVRARPPALKAKRRRRGCSSNCVMIPSRSHPHW